jgi:hypothetical protein
MILRKRIHALARSSLAAYIAVAYIAVALGACSAGTYPTSTAQTPDPPTRQSGVADSGPILPEVVVSARRLPPPRIAKETWPRPPTKRGS